MDSIPEDVLRSMVPWFLTEDVLRIRCVSTTTRTMCQHHIISKYPIKGRLRYWKSSFPYLKTAAFTRPRSFIEEDFIHMKDIDTLKMTSKFNGIHPSYFKHLTRLTSLNLQGSNIKISAYTFYQLTSLSVDYDLSNEDLRQFTQLTYLSIRNLPHICYGMHTLVNLRTLDLYNIQDLTDEVFNFIPHLEHLSMTFGELSTRGISKCKQLKTLHVIGGSQMHTLKGLETLPLLHTVHITYGKIDDSDMAYVSHIRKLVLYDTTRIQGHGLQYLANLEYLAMYEIPFLDEGISCLLTLPIRNIYMYRCREVSLNKKKELTNRLSGRFHSD